MKSFQRRLAGCTAIALVMVVVSVYFYSAPKIALSQTELDLGTVPKGQKTYAALSLRNVGCRTLHILQVEALCECTIARIDKHELRPGEVANVQVQLDSTTLSGNVYRLISIQTDAPINSTVFIPMSCTVTDGIR